MKVYAGFDQFTPPTTGVALTIGNFDGVHRGHQCILEKVREISGSLAAPAVVVTLEPHPLVVLAPQRALARLVTLPEKLHLLRNLGADACIVLRSEPQLLTQSAEEFLGVLTRACRPRVLVEGPDFHFGWGRAGSIQTLREYSTRLGFAVHVIDTARGDELPGRPSVHSAAIRAALREGRVEVARAMLGRPYRIVGVVAGGAGRGRDLGYPTANLEDIPHLLPQHGVYAAVAQLDDDRLTLAAVNVGPQPTFEERASRVEAHLLDWNAPLRGQVLGLHFLARLRSQQRFCSRADLVARLERDVMATRRYESTLAELRACPPIPVKDEEERVWD